MNRLSVALISSVAIIVLAMAALAFIMQPQHPQPASAVGLPCGNGTLLWIHVETADTNEERVHGLMNRTSLPVDAGMLFVFDDDAPRHFWMENTLIPLDMIFIAGNLTIIDIYENAAPQSRDIISSAGPCRYVLEVNGGLCAANGIGTGDRITLDLN